MAKDNSKEHEGKPKLDRRGRPVWSIGPNDHPCDPPTANEDYPDRTWACPSCKRVWVLDRRENTWDPALISDEAQKQRAHHQIEIDKERVGELNGG